MTTYESIYQGADNLLMPKYNFTDYEMNVGSLGMPIDPRTANQLGVMGNSTLNTGAKIVEIGSTQADVLESIPDPHFKEMERLTKLTGVKPSFHAPVIEASGIGERGWDEANRFGAEQQLKSAVLRAQKLDPKGNISVTVHSTAGLSEMQPVIKEGKDIKETGLWIINSKSGQVNFIQPQERFFPEQGKFKEGPIKFDYNKELKRINEEQWSQGLAGANRYNDYGDQELRMAKNEIPKELFLEIASGKLNIDKIEGESDKELIKNTERRITSGRIYLKEAYRNMKELFDNAWQATTSETDRKNLREFAEKIAPIAKDDLEKNPDKMEKLAGVIDKGLKILEHLEQPPKIFKPLQEFAIQKSSQTFANVAESAYKKYGNNAPMINIENPPAGSGLSKAEDLKELIKESRKKLTKNLHDKGMSTGQAKKVAEQMIGATWDVGHINMLRKQGYSEKDIIEQTEIIAPFVKHVHLSDNFGLDHTELPMGMGNVPIKEMMKKLGKKGFEAKKIIEAGNWWQHFAEHGGGNPFKPTIQQSFDSPIYAMKAGPSWSESGGIPGYSLGHGPINPPIHHRVYGAGFEALPVELGGEIPGDQSRFAGAPNQ